MRILKQDTKQVHLEFSNLSQLADLDSRMRPEQETFDSSKTGSNSFAGCSFDEAVVFANYGWHEGRDQLLNLTETGIDQLDRDILPIERRDVAGFRPDVPAFCAGDPANMVQRDEEVKPAVLRLLVDRSLHCKVNAKQIMNYGGALLAWVELVEREGIRCEIWTSNKVYSVNKTLTTRVLIKEADQPFDYGALAFALAHPAFLRRLQFRAWEQFAEIWRGQGTTKSGFNDGYGTPATGLPYEFEGTYFLVPNINDNYDECDSLDGALKIFENQIVNVLQSYNMFQKH